MYGHNLAVYEHNLVLFSKLLDYARTLLDYARERCALDYARDITVAKTMIKYYKLISNSGRVVLTHHFASFWIISQYKRFVSAETILQKRC